MTPAELQRELASGRLRPAYLLAGSEALLRDEASRAITEAVLADGPRDFNFDRFDGAQLYRGSAAGCSSFASGARRAASRRAARAGGEGSRVEDARGGDCRRGGGAAGILVHGPGGDRVDNRQAFEVGEGIQGARRTGGVRSTQGSACGRRLPEAGGGTPEDFPAARCGRGAGRCRGTPAPDAPPGAREGGASRGPRPAREPPRCDRGRQ